MPRASLSFSLPEEESEFRDAQEGGAWKYLVLDFLSHIRNELKHGEASAERAAILEEVRELIWHSIEDRKLKVE